jgi:hypothetical protein
MELDPRYVDVIVQRRQDYPGYRAVLDRGGGALDQLGKSRNSGAE